MRYEVLSLEEAAHHVTYAPARIYGLKGRGRVAEGMWADIVVFDEDAIGSGPIHTRFDLPARAPRLYADAIGMDRVLVKGVEVAASGEITGELPGTLLRSGRDTQTPPLA